ncbi:hypothetical protein TVAG_315850 [Trichomonas vaginalis G3]|uniref:Spt20-like SEP domain-containing protein n=1 Tax=Trichomonas vaginalis (strain ATCC PRA-98 / G3) TaxID=412133 RepID=A2FLP4_TRIV3|nr:Spt20 family [Trichomonas vaginalis G3]EAX94179.1 hypothetical protein TVAG_315850 [Trichomonas vaginalis G3]KAI5540679.1 Spt20 family [Trichomonas vaginalis G3]|eukprot:XP_001307109.1 hypothetical protein [Trichomonas vaginalis G3]
MSEWRRVQFFRQNILGTMTDRVGDPTQPIDLYKKVHQESLNLVLQNIATGDFSDQHLQPYMTRLSYFTESLSNPKFNKLTPDFEIYSDKTSVEFKFWNDYFTISSKNSHENEIPFCYNNNLYPILEDIENGVISKMLFKILRYFKLEFLDGKVLVAIIDYRSNIEQRHYAELSITPEYFKELTKEYPPIIQDKIFTDLTSKEICNDPSPNVARYSSIVDWREKMWKPERKYEYCFEPKEPELPIKKPDFKVIGTNQISDFQLPADIKIPDLVLPAKK